MSKRGKKKGGGFGQWVRNAEKDARRRSQDWHVSRKDLKRISKGYAHVLYDVEGVLLAVFRQDSRVDDRTVLEGVRCALGDAVSIDERANEIARALRETRATYTLHDGEWRAILRVVMDSIHNHSALTPGATGYLTFIRAFITPDDEECEEDDSDLGDDDFDGDETPTSVDWETYVALVRAGPTAAAEMVSAALLQGPLMLPWYRAEDWTRLKALASDSDTLPADYEAWKRETHERISKAAREKVIWIMDFGVEEWQAFCADTGMPPDRSSRDSYLFGKFLSMKSLNEGPDSRGERMEH